MDEANERPDCAADMLDSACQQATSCALIDDSAYDSGTDSTTSRKGDEFAVPYVVGATIQAMKHVPAEPFGYGYDTQYPQINENWEDLSQAALCTMRVPLGGHTIPNEKNVLTITAILRTGVDQGAQLVIVNQTLVAKIYDPLFYEYINEYNAKEHVVINADGDYTREAAAYKWLQNSTTAKHLTPAFHGTWVTTIETCSYHCGEFRTDRRQVPLILIDLVNGKVMSRIDAYAVDARIRTQIMKKVLTADALLVAAGLEHDDYCPRNIIITNLHGTGANDEAEGLGVKVIDFNIATIMRHPQASRRDYLGFVDELEKTWHPKILSPIIRWYGHMAEFSVPGWCSNERDGSEQWLWEQFHDDERFIPVVWDPEDPDLSPEYMQSQSVSDDKPTVPVSDHDEMWAREVHNDTTYDSKDHTRATFITYA
ncbi:hypothetical protein J1614_003311 [Plenodomus biglobosus]|nr:hypothetical protein J1614_003311 [Plenodomus biglobosus]